MVGPPNLICFDQLIYLRLLTCYPTCSTHWSCYLYISTSYVLLTSTLVHSHVIQILSLADGEKITSIIPVSEFAEDQYLLMLTANGYIKKVSLMYFSSIRSSGIIALQLVCLSLLSLKILYYRIKYLWMFTYATCSRSLVIHSNGSAIARIKTMLQWLHKTEWLFLVLVRL